MRLILARHAQTNYNVRELANADPSVDVHLTEKGIEQANQLADSLKDRTIDIIFISELPRTRETANYVNKYRHKNLIVDPRLNDNKTGFESKPIREWLAVLEASPEKWSVEINDGESLQHAANRTREFIDELRRSPYQSILVVTHGFITKSIYAYLNQISLEEADKFDLK